MEEREENQKNVLTGNEHKKAEKQKLSVHPTKRQSRQELFY